MKRTLLIVLGAGLFTAATAVPVGAGGSSATSATIGNLDAGNVSIQGTLSVAGTQTGYNETLQGTQVADAGAVNTLLVTGQEQVSGPAATATYGQGAIPASSTIMGNSVAGVVSFECDGGTLPTGDTLAVVTLPSAFPDAGFVVSCTPEFQWLGHSASTSTNLYPTCSPASSSTFSVRAAAGVGCTVDNWIDTAYHIEWLHP